MIDIDVAKPFTMLSAYFMTAAITKPPRADKAIIRIARLSMPWNQPFSITALASTNATFKSANKIPKKPLKIYKN